MGKQLAVLAGPDEGRIFPLDTEAFLVGRSRATDTNLIDPHVSRVHCQISQERDDFVLTDFDSAGGTFVNGKKISRYKLQPGDIIRIGATRLQFAEESAVPPPTAPYPGPATTPELEGAATLISVQPVGAAAKAHSARPSGKTRGAAAKVPVAKPALGGRNWAQALAGQRFSHFKVGSLLARGRSGYVFHARDLRRNEAIALKILDPDFSANERSVKKFVQAMKTVMPLRHPNLLKYFGAGRTEKHCWVAMEYVPGDSLAAVIGRIETTGMLDWRQVLRVAIYLARALDYAHHRKTVHQAVTPTNILLGKTNNEVKLADLMLASAIEGDPTKPISAAGVPNEQLSYMPPERTDGPSKTFDFRTDIYCLGATIYALLSGQPPFQASTVQELVEKIRLEAPTPLRSLHTGAPEALERIIHKCLAKRPQDRFLTAADLRKELEGLANEHGLTV